MINSIPSPVLDARDVGQEAEFDTEHVYMQMITFIDSRGIESWMLQELVNTHLTVRVCQMSVSS